MMLDRDEREALAILVERTCDMVLNNDQVLAIREIATMAIDLDELEDMIRIEKADLSTAYKDHKSRLGSHAYLQPDSPEWAAMIDATRAEYAAVQEAKAAAKSAKRSLRRAIAQYRKRFPAEFPQA